MFYFYIHVSSAPDRLGYEDRLIVCRDWRVIGRFDCSTAPDSTEYPWIAPGRYKAALNWRGNLSLNSGGPVDSRASCKPCFDQCAIHRGRKMTPIKGVRGSKGCISIAPDQFPDYRKMLLSFVIREAEVIIAG